MGVPHDEDYKATCWRDDSGWLVRVRGLGRTARTARLGQVEAAARGLIAAHVRRDPGSVRVTVDPLVSDAVRAALDAAAPADDRSGDAELRRRALRNLADEGIALRDIATLLRVSYAEVQQLLGAAGRLYAAVAETPSRSTAASSGVGYHHEALIYRRTAGFLAGVLPFIREGVAAGQPVFVALIAPRLVALRAALGADADNVEFVDMGQLGRNPARIIPAWQEYVDAHAGAGTIRGVGEPIWAGRSPEEIAECQLHEGLLNLAVDADTPMLLLCPYDAEGVGLAVVYEALRSHPLLSESGGIRESTRFEGAQQAESMFAAPLPAAPERTDEFSFGPQGLAAVRDRVRRHGYDAGMRADRVADLTTAMNELATNSIQHGGGYGVLRSWRKDKALVCEISDAGHITDPLVGRKRPATDETPGRDRAGRGMWLVNQVCDLVQVRSSPKGTTARVLSWI